MAQITGKVLSVVPKTTDNGFDYMLMVMDNNDVVTIWPSELDKHLDQKQTLAMLQTSFHGFAPILKAASVEYDKVSDKDQVEYTVSKIVIDDQLGLVQIFADAYIQRMSAI